MRSYNLVGFSSSFNFLFEFQIVICSFLSHLRCLLAHCQFAFYCCDKTSWSQATWGGKGLSYTFTSHPITERSQVGTQARAESETLKEHSLLVAQPAFLNVLRLKWAWPLTSIINQVNAPQTCQFNGGNSSTRDSSSQMTPVCVKMTKANHTLPELLLLTP